MNVISAETTFHGTPLEAYLKLAKKLFKNMLGRLTVIVDTNPFNPK